MLGFTVALSILTGLLMGAYPALAKFARRFGRGTERRRPRNERQRAATTFSQILVGAQVALSVTLLAGAALLITSFVRLSRQNIGFNADNLWVGGITLPQAQYPDIGHPRAVLSTERWMHCALFPDFEHVALSGDIPLNGGGLVFYARADREVLPVEKRAAAPGHQITPDTSTPGAFRFWPDAISTQHDTGNAQKMVVISQAGAKDLFGNENPIGHTLLVTSYGVPAEIIGVVGDVRSLHVAEQNDMEFYRPLAQDNFPFLNIAVRSRLKPEAVTKLVQSTLNGVDPGLAIAQPGPMSEIVARRSDKRV